MRVDGFRFDLATRLARHRGEFDPQAAFFDIIAQDPVLCRVKLIAEPWDLGEPDSYAVGRFPAPWSEWNDRYRDTVRDFWRGSTHALPDFATRIAGSSDLYGPARRRPTASINFITAHDGFTLRDLVSYTASTTRPTARTTGTEPPTTGHGTAAPKALPATRESWRCAPASPARCWPRCCCPAGSR
jgi:isoamylase